MKDQPTPEQHCASGLRRWRLDFAPIRWPHEQVRHFWQCRVRPFKSAANSAQ